MLNHLIKTFTIKRIIARNSVTFVPPKANYIFDKVGVLVDGNRFENKTVLIEKLKEYGLGNTEITFLIFKNKKNKDIDVTEYFSPSDFNLSAEIIDQDVQDFCDSEYDLLVCYYDKKISYLNLINCLSKAKFKVGFSEVKSSFNQLDINVELDDYETYFSELYKYLTIIKNK